MTKRQKEMLVYVSQRKLASCKNRQRRIHYLFVTFQSSSVFIVHFAIKITPYRRNEELLLEGITGSWDRKESSLQTNLLFWNVSKQYGESKHAKALLLSSNVKLVLDLLKFLHNITTCKFKKIDTAGKKGLVDEAAKDEQYIPNYKNVNLLIFFPLKIFAITMLIFVSKSRYTHTIYRNY